MTNSAVVARVRLDAIEYLNVTETGESVWSFEPADAAVFPTMRDATRHALRLPSALRAFALPSSSAELVQPQRRAA